MPNNLTGLIPTMYNALDMVARELVGFIPAVSMDATHARAAVGQTVRTPVTAAAPATNITPAVTPPNDGDQTVGYTDMTITKSRRVPIRWNGEERLGVDNNGAQFNIIFRDQMAQAMRTLTNEVESDLGALYAQASRAYGTAGTTPFATNTGELMQARKILVDNGAQGLELNGVLDSAAGASLRTLFNLNSNRLDASQAMQNQGVLVSPAGIALRESAYVKIPTVGTGASATTNAAGYAVGATVITLASAGTGTILAGDVITFAGDTNKYVVASGDTNVSDGGTITLAAPGLWKAIPASATAITVISSGPRSMLFARNAIALATRAPALPLQGDSAVDRTIITDPISGLSFEVAMYAQYRQMQYEVSLAWGVKAVKPEFMALILG